MDVAIAGITGTRSAAVEDTARAVRHIKGSTDLPVAIGFGVKSAAQAADFARIGDAVVVGSAIVDIISKGGDHVVEHVTTFVEALAEGVHSASRENAA